MNDNIQLSFVIPVYNGSESIPLVVQRIHESFDPENIEVVLVNDGSADASEQVCIRLVDEYPGSVRFLQLTRNFGEHNAILAGLRHARGRYNATLDDDGQNPPEEVARMLSHLKEGGFDVVYGFYKEKKHSRFRNLGSRLNDRFATLLLGKPSDIYFSSFKVMTRSVADEIVKYRGPFPYVDGLIYRCTNSIGQVDVVHREREKGHSGYTLRKLIALWLNMFCGFSIMPLRLSAFAGLLVSIVSVVLLIGVIIDKVWLNPDLTVGIPTILVAIIFFGGVQLLILGAIGEYVGRVFLEQNGMPQYVVRYERSNSAFGGAPASDESAKSGLSSFTESSWLGSAQTLAVDDGEMH